MTSRGDALPKCIFCQGTNWCVTTEATNRGWSHRWQYQCSHCGARGPAKDTQAEAMQSWTRAMSAAPPAEVLVSVIARALADYDLEASDGAQHQAEYVAAAVIAALTRRPAPQAEKEIAAAQWLSAGPGEDNNG